MYVRRKAKNKKEKKAGVRMEEREGRRKERKVVTRSIPEDRLWLSHRTA